LEFIPETGEDEVGFFPEKVEDGETVDMRRIWNLIEERKRDDSLLRREFGWGSQSGVSASQMSIQPSQPVFRPSPDGVGGIEEEEVVESEARQEDLALAADVVDTNGIEEGEKTVSEHEGIKESVNIAEQDEEEDEVGLPWF
jgi:hypothetical protein